MTCAIFIRYIEKAVMQHLFYVQDRPQTQSKYLFPVVIIL